MDAILLGCHRNDRAPLGGFVRVAGKQCCLGGFPLRNAGDDNNLGRKTIAESDGSGLVQQQCIDVAGSLHRAPRHRKNVEAHQAVHTRNTDGGQKRPDGGRDQRDEQRNQHHHRDRAACIGDIARNSGRREYENDGQAYQQNVQCNFVRSLLPLGSFHQLDHAIEKRRPR